MAVCTACNNMEVAEDQMEAHMASDEHQANAANAEAPAEAPAEGGEAPE